jgi:hypothetical protein
MSPEGAPPQSFGRTPAAAARAAAVLAVLGGAVVLALERFLTRPGTPLGEAFGATGIPPLVPALAGFLIVLGLAVTGYWKAVRSAEQFRIAPAGLVVAGSLGEYTLAWENIAEAQATPGDALGIRVKSRDAVLATHQGTEQQREWLRTLEPFGEWDFLYPRADLGHPAETVLPWIQPYLRRETEADGKT